MPSSAARRLYGYLSNQDLYEALLSIHAPTSGNKEERINRLLAHMAQPRLVLRIRAVSLEELRNICREIGANLSGSKDELVNRIVSHVAAGRDIRHEPEPPPPIAEPRHLDETRFRDLFSILRGHELAVILAEFDLRRWGTKEAQVKTLWEACRSEETLLNTLSSADLEGILERLDMRTAGTKAERVQRLIDRFAPTAEGTMKA